MVREDDQEPGVLVIHLPDPITTEGEGPDGTIVNFNVTADGTSDPSPQVTCDPASDSTFPLGTTTVHCEAKDNLGNSASGDFTVTVMDGRPPVLTNLRATPDTLSPPSGKLVLVTISANARDLVDPMPRCFVFSVTSNQQIDGDYELKGDLEIELRAERDGGDAREYYVNVSCIDASSNATGGSVTVTVPRGSSQSSEPVVTPTPPTPTTKKPFRKWW